MSNQVPSYFSPWPHSNLYEFYSNQKPVIPHMLMDAYNDILDAILNKTEHKKELTPLNEAINDAFSYTTPNEIQIQMWMQYFIDTKKIMYQKQGTEIILAFTALIYDHYVKSNPSVTFAGFCQSISILKSLIPIEEKFPGLLHYLGKKFAAHQIPLDAHILIDLVRKHDQCTEEQFAMFVGTVLKDVPANEEGEELKLNVLKSFLLQAFKKNKILSVNMFIEKAEAMVKTGILSKQKIAESLQILTKFLPEDIGNKHFLKLIDIIKPALYIPSKQISHLFMNLLSKTKNSDIHQFWNLWHSYEDLLLHSKEKERFLELIFQEISKDHTLINKVSSKAVMELIKTNMLFKDGINSTLSDLDLLITLIESMDVKIKQRLLTNGDLFPFSVVVHGTEEEKKKFYSALKNMCAKENRKNYDNVPLPLIFALALAATENFNYAHHANLLWTLYKDQLPSELKPLVGRVLISKLWTSDIPSSAKIWNNLIDLGLPVDKGLECLKKISVLYQKQEKHDINALKPLASGLIHIIKKHNEIGRVISPEYSESIQWILSSLAKHDCLKECKELWWVVYKNSKSTTPILDSLITPLAQNQQLFLNIIHEPALFNSLDNAICVLSIIKPFQASLWKTIFDKLILENDKKCCQKAWNAFIHCLENQEKIQGTSTEVASTCLSAIKMASFKQPSLLLQVLGKEKFLFSLFEPSENETLKQSVQKLYQVLSDVCFNLDSNVHLENLIKFRESVKEACEAPLGKSPFLSSGDLRLATMLSKVPTFDSRYKALQLAIDLEKKKEALEIVDEIFELNLTDKEQKKLVAPILNLFREVPEHLIEAIQQHKKVACVLNYAPKESWQIICEDYRKAQCPSRLTFTFLQLGMELLPHLNMDHLHFWKQELVRQFDNSKNLHSKSEFKKWLTIHHKQILDMISDNPQFLFHFLIAIKELSLHVLFSQEDVDRCLSIFSNEEENPQKPMELKPIFIWFISFIGNASDPKKLLPIYLDLIQRSSKECKLNDDDPLITGCSDLLNRCKVEELAPLLDQFMISTNGQSLAPEIICLFVKELSSIILNWDQAAPHSPNLLIKVFDQLAKQSSDANRSSDQELFFQRIPICLIAGEQADFQSNCEKLQKIIENTNTPEGLARVAHWLWIALNNADDSRKQTIIKEVFMCFHKQVCNLSLNKPINSKEVIKLYCFIFKQNWISSNDLNTIITITAESPGKEVIESGLIAILDLLQRKETQDKQTICAHFEKLLAIAERGKLPLMNFVMKCIKYPMLKFDEWSEAPSKTAAMLNIVLMQSLSHQVNILKGSNKTLTKQGKELYSYCEPYFPIILKNEKNDEYFIKFITDYLAFIAIGDNSNRTKTCFSKIRP